MVPIAFLRPTRIERHENTNNLPLKVDYTHALFTILAAPACSGSRCRAGTGRAAGDEIVTAGQTKIFDGAAVKTIPATGIDN